MREPLSITVAQPPTFSHEVAINALAHAATMRAAGTRVVVFPELSLTGYEFGAPPLRPDDPSLWPLVEACAEIGSVALVGAPVAADQAGHRRDEQQSQIAMLAVDGTGVTVVYRKVYLGEAEPARFVPGDKPAILEIDGWRLGLAICKDTGVPQHAADTAALGIDAYVAGITEYAEDAAVLPERARRITTNHGVWVAFASFAGPTGGGFDHTPGRSSIWAPDGTLLAAASDEPGDLARATFKP